MFDSFGQISPHSPKSTALMNTYKQTAPKDILKNDPGQIDFSKDLIYFKCFLLTNSNIYYGLLVKIFIFMSSLLSTPFFSLFCYCQGFSLSPREKRWIIFWTSPTFLRVADPYVVRCYPDVQGQRKLHKCEFSPLLSYSYCL